MTHTLQPAPNLALSNDDLDNIDDMLAGYKSIVDGCKAAEIERFDYLPSIERALENFRNLRAALASQAQPEQPKDSVHLTSDAVVCTATAQLPEDTYMDASGLARCVYCGQPDGGTE